mmetsp:Transcript_17429/g.48575  ORF Transcript_17429/g.48575 Transcript_17429/m.48575 type:complete len:953 (-) Transcript_17429:429-3287(-)
MEGAGVEADLEDTADLFECGDDDEEEGDGSGWGFDDDDDDDDDGDDDEEQQEEEAEDEGGYGSSAHGFGEDAYPAGGSDDENEIFLGQFDPMSLLQDMESAGGEREGARAVEIIASARESAMDGGEDELGGSAAHTVQLQQQDRELRGGKRRKRGGATGSHLFGATVEDIYDSPALGSGLRGRGRRRKRKRKGRPTLEESWPPEVKDMMAKATADYALGRHKPAAELLTEVIRRMPNHPDAYRLMGLLNEDMGNKRRALAFFMLEAHLTKKDAEPWKRVARLSMELGLRRQAVYCLKGLIRRTKDNLSARHDKAVLLAELGEPNKAISELEAVQKLSDGNPEVPKIIVRLYHQVGKPRKAMEAMEAYLQQFPQKSDLTHINILCELYVQFQMYAEAQQLIDRAEAVLCSGGSLPVDLLVKRGICLFHDNQREAAKHCVMPLLDMSGCHDLVEQVADMFQEGEDYQTALSFYEVLLDEQARRRPGLLRNVTACYRNLGSLGMAVKLYEEAIADVDPSEDLALEYVLAVCELKIEMGRQKEAHEIILGFVNSRGGYGSSVARSSAGGRGDSAHLHVCLSQVYLRLGEPYKFAETLLPCIYATLRESQAKLSTKPKAPRPIGGRQLKLMLARRNKLRQKGQLGSDGGLFTPGFKVRDRRREEVKALEQQYAPLIEEMEKMMGQPTPAESGSGGAAEGDSREGQQEGTSEAEAALVIPGMLATKGDKFDMFLQVLHVLIHSDDTELVKEAHELIQQAKSLVRNDRRNTFPLRDNLRLMKMEADCKLQLPIPAWREFRYIVGRWPASLKLLNLYSQILCKAAGAVKITRSATAMRSQFPNSVPLMLLSGNMHASVGALPEAINEYVHAFHRQPGEPLVCLCLGVALLKDAMAFRASNRHRSVVQVRTPASSSAPNCNSPEPFLVCFCGQLEVGREKWAQRECSRGGFCAVVLFRLER